MKTKETMTAETSGENRNGPGGRTKIADVVVESIAGIATREAPGVYAMGDGASRAMGAVRDKVQSGEKVTRGVHAEVGEKQAAVDINFVVEYGATITDTARQVRSNVSGAIGRMTGLEVVEVNVDVVDVHLPEESGDGDSGSSTGDRSTDRGDGSNQSRVE